MTDAAMVAKGLTKAQQRAILAAAPRRDGDPSSLFLPAYRDRGRLVDSIYTAGLASVVMRGVMLNSYGLAVRAELLKQEQQG